MGKDGEWIVCRVVHPLNAFMDMVESESGRRIEARLVHLENAL